MFYFLVTFFLFLFSFHSQDAPAQKASIALDYAINPHQAPLLLAKALGYFKEQGLDVSFTFTSSGEEACRLLRAKHVHMASSKQPSAMLRIYDEKDPWPLRHAGTLIPHCLEGVLSKDPAFSTLVVGGSSLAFAHYVVDRIQKIHKNITVEWSAKQLTQRFLNPTTHAIYPAYLTYHLHDIQRFYKKPLTFVPLSAFNIPSFCQNILLVHKDHDPVVIKKILEAIQKALIYIHGNPKKAWGVIKKNFSELARNSHDDKLFDTLWPYFSKNIYAHDTDQAKNLFSFLFKKPPLTCKSFSPFDYFICSPPPLIKTLTVYLDWFLNPHHAPLLIANDFLKDYGVRIQWISAGSSEEGYRHVLSKSADMCISSEPRFWICQKARGMPLHWLATLIDHPLEALVVHSRVPYTSLASLKGLCVGHASSGMGFGRISLQALLEKGGLTFKDVSPKYVHFNLISALLSGQVDAITNVYVTYEAQDILKHDPKAHIIPLHQIGIPPFAESILLTHPKRANDPYLNLLVACLSQAVQSIQKNPQKSFKRLIAYAPELNTPANQEAWGGIVPHFCPQCSKVHTHSKPFETLYKKFKENIF
jgi:putative hydroxymethylpyrimidine transport system substrate-binding protein